MRGSDANRERGIKTGTSMSVLSQQYAALRMMYSTLPVIEHRRSSGDQPCFSSRHREEHFALLLPYAPSGSILLEHSLQECEEFWTLVTGSVDDVSADDFLSTAMRLAKIHVDPVNHPGDVEPFAFIEETVESVDATTKRFGVAFLARVRIPSSTFEGSSEAALSSVALTETSRMTMTELDTQILREAIVRLAEKADRPAPSYDRESELATRYRWRFIMHHSFFKPVLRIASKIFGETSLDEVQKEIASHALREANESFLDVACGENGLCLELAAMDKLTLIVSNDVAWPHIDLLRTRRVGPPSSSILLFTNHDATALPFENGTFGASLCKNALHHVDPTRAGRLVREAVRVARRALVVEVMDPECESSWGRVRHLYYLRFLKDAGIKFYSRSEFSDLTDIPSRRALYERRTVKGVYMFALFDGATNSMQSPGDE